MTQFLLDSDEELPFYYLPEQELTMLVTYREYEDHLVDQNSFEVSVAADVLESDYQFHAREDFRVRMPDVKFEVQMLLIPMLQSILCDVYDVTVFGGSDCREITDSICGPPKSDPAKPHSWNVCG